MGATHLVYVGGDRVWSCTRRGDVCVWETSTGQRKQTWSLGTAVRLHSMCAVEMHGVPTVWLGCDDEVRVFDCTTRSLHCVLPLPSSGEVTCLANAGINIVWAGVRHRGGDKGSVYIYDFSL
jgi:hypothetical protein